MLEPCNAKVLRTVLRGLGASNRAWLLGGFASPETELASRWCSNARPLVEPTNEAIANDGGVSHWCSVTHCRDGRCDSAADWYRVGRVSFGDATASSFFMGALLSARAG